MLTVALAECGLELQKLFKRVTSLLLLSSSTLCLCGFGSGVFLHLVRQHRSVFVYMRRASTELGLPVSKHARGDHYAHIPEFIVPL